MPFAGFDNFADCMSKVKANSAEGKRKICGSLKAKHEAKMEAEQKVAELKVKKLEIEQILLAKLTSKARKKLPTSSFVYPKEKRYPIHDIAHARNALARVAQHGTPAEKAKVRAAVCRKFPQIASCKEKKK